MDVESEKMYLQNIEEYVMDEDKIVTYKWLSEVLSIPVSDSKQLLYTFLSDPAHQNSVRSTFLVAGFRRDNKGYLITVVDQDKLDEVKESLTSCVEHVYSVQKSKCTPAPSTLYTVDSQRTVEENGDPKWLGSIRCGASIQRAQDEMSRLRLSSKPLNASDAEKKPAGSKSDTKSSPQPNESKNKSETSEQAKKTEVKGKGGIAAMFAAQGSKAASKPAAATVSTSSKAKGVGKKGAGISSFFNKVQSEDVTEVSNASKDIVKIESQKPCNGSMEVKDTVAKTSVKGTTSDMMDVDEKPSTKELSHSQKQSFKSDGAHVDEKLATKETSKKQKETKRKSRGKENSKKPEAKRRKRIVAVESDSEDDIFGVAEDASSREPSPEPEPEPPSAQKALESDDDDDVIPPTPVESTNSARARRRRKVTKDKTFEDEDGYIVTQKVTEYESFSESDGENSDSKKMKENGVTKVNSTPSVPKKQVVKEKQATKKASPAKSKQQSLTSFFKKA